MNLLMLSSGKVDRLSNKIKRSHFIYCLALHDNKTLHQKILLMVWYELETEASSTQAIFAWNVFVTNIFDRVDGTANINDQRKV